MTKNAKYSLDDVLRGDGQALPTSPVPSLRGALPPIAARLMGEWFQANFEPPAVSTQYIYENIDYRHVGGGPYTSEDLAEVFESQLSRAVRRLTAQELDTVSRYWIPHVSRSLPPDDEADWDRAEWDRARWPDPATAAHADMLARIEAVERTLSAADASAGGRGHNRPPGPIDDLPLPPIDREEIGRALALLKSQPVQPETTAFVPIEAALKVIGGAAAKVAAWFAARVNDFATAAVKAAGGVAGTAIAGWGVWKQLDAELQALVVASLKWAGIINLPL